MESCATTDSTHNNIENFVELNIITISAYQVSSLVFLATFL